MKYKVKQATIDIILICMTLYEPIVLPHLLFIAIKYCIVIYLFVRYVGELKNSRLLVYAILFYGSITILSTIVNRMALNTMVASFVYMIHIFDIFAVSTAITRRFGIYNYVKVLFRTLLIILITADILMLFLPYDFNNPSEEYLIGNKFDVAYLHCFASALCFFYNSKYNKKITGENVFKHLIPIAFLLYSTWICSVVTCSTGIVICILLGLTIFIPLKIKKIFSSGKIMVIVIILMNILIFGSYNLFMNPVFLEIVTNVFGKSYTWTGRLIIYEILFEIIIKKPFIGYGYYNSIVALAVSFSGNAQNGLLKVIIDSGIIGAIGFLSIFYLALRKNRQDKENCWYFYAFLYVMIAASAVEISLTCLLVFLSVAIIYGKSCLTAAD